ncbi:DUF3948 family protein [Bacillus cereus]
MKDMKEQVLQVTKGDFVRIFIK